MFYGAYVVKGSWAVSWSREQQRNLLRNQRFWKTIDIFFSIPFVKGLICGY